VATTVETAKTSNTAITIRFMGPQPLSRVDGSLAHIDPVMPRISRSAGLAFCKSLRHPGGKTQMVMLRSCELRLPSAKEHNPTTKPAVQEGSTARSRRAGSLLTLAGFARADGFSRTLN